MVAHPIRQHDPAKRPVKPAHLRTVEPAPLRWTFGAYLGYLLAREGLSQNELARRAGCNAAYVNRLVRGVVGANDGGGKWAIGRALVNDLAGALALDEPEAERLLLLAGYAPARAMEQAARRHAAGRLPWWDALGTALGEG